jgi:hypothetical protein
MRCNARADSLSMPVGLSENTRNPISAVVGIIHQDIFSPKPRREHYVMKPKGKQTSRLYIILLGWGS